MAKAAVRHYRVAKKEVEQKNGSFIPEKEKPKILVLALVILLFIFAKGIIIGYLAGSRKR